MHSCRQINPGCRRGCSSGSSRRRAIGDCLRLHQFRRLAELGGVIACIRVGRPGKAIGAGQGLALGSILKNATQQEFTRLATALSLSLTVPPAPVDQLDVGAESNANMISAEWIAPFFHSFFRKSGTVRNC